MNLQIEKVRQDLTNVINNSGLPIGVIYYLFKDISKDIAQEYERILSFEQKKLQEEQEKQKENETENNEKESE